MELVEDPKKVKKMGKAGRKLVENEFSIKNVINQHFKIYRELFSKFERP